MQSAPLPRLACTKANLMPPAAATLGQSIGPWKRETSMPMALVPAFAEAGAGQEGQGGDGDAPVNLSRADGMSGFCKHRLGWEERSTTPCLFPEVRDHRVKPESTG